MKQKIFHFIFNLGRGGAETIVVTAIKEMPEYQHVVVTLFPMNHFGDELKCDKLICLNLSSLFSLPMAVFKFRKLIKQEKPCIIHTHLFWPTTIARIATPKNIPVITTIHAFIASSVEYKKWFVKLIDKVTYRLRKNVILADAQGALDEYFSFLNLKPYKAYCLYTFVDTNKFKISNNIAKTESNGVFKIISVGALRKQKNQVYLVEAFAKIKTQPVELHIYGTGELKESLQQKIDETGAKVVLKGEVNNLHEIIPNYDLYIMASTYEGFSLAVLEAMGMGMPLLLSNIPSFKEQGKDTASYFELDDTNSATEQILMLSKKPKAELQAMGQKTLARVKAQFTLQHHVDTLRMVYSTTLADYR
jgi:glycosyltransferase involved in cell wall biosynthesis